MMARKGKVAMILTILEAVVDEKPKKKPWKDEAMGKATRRTRSCLMIS